MCVDVETATEEQEKKGKKNKFQTRSGKGEKALDTFSFVVFVLFITVK